MRADFCACPDSIAKADVWCQWLKACFCTPERLRMDSGLALRAPRNDPGENRTPRPSEHCTLDASAASAREVRPSRRAHRFFQPPRLPGAPPLERGAGPNSGPDWRESVGWMILLSLP